MMYKATVTFSLFFLAVVGSAQNLKDGGSDSLAQPPSNFSSTSASQVYPSDIPIPTNPTLSDGDTSQTNRTELRGCYPHNGTHSAIPTDQPLPSGVFPSGADDATPVSKPHFSCEFDSGSTTPTGTANVPAYSASALPFTNVSNMAPNGTNKGPDQQDPPVATATTTTYGKLDYL